MLAVDDAAAGSGPLPAAGSGATEALLTISPLATIANFLGRCANKFRNRGSRRTTRLATSFLPAERIRWHQDRIGACSVQLEQRFLVLTKGIETLSGKSGELVLRSRALLKRTLGNTEEGSALQGAIDLVKGPLAFQSECLQVIGDLGVSLETMSSRISKLDRFRTKLDRSIAPLKLLQTMFRIESVTCSAEIQALFTAISFEIERLQARMSTMVLKEFEAIGNTQATLKAVMQRLREIQLQQSGTAGRRCEIEASLLYLQEQVQLNSDRDTRLTGVIHAIAGKVDQVITALQYQDILSQRLEHISHGLSEMADHCDAAAPSTYADLVSFLRDLSRVEAAQVEEVERVLETAIETLHSSLNGISAEIGDVDGECRLLRDIESASATGDSVVQILLDALGETRKFNESTYVQTDDVCRALEPISGLVGSLTASILEVSIQIRLIAINAQIQAVNAGVGTGLEVLSARTCSISAEIASIVSEISTELTALKDGLRDGLETIGRTRSRNLEFTELLKTSGGEQELLLHQFRTQAKVELHCVQELITEVHCNSKSLRSSLDVSTAVLEVTSLARAELNEFSNRLAACASAEPPNARVEERALSYTAAAQRATHDRALRGECASEPEESPAAEIAEGSVEFF